MKLKVFSYSYSIDYGKGCGVVIAKTKEDAIKMICASPYSRYTKVVELELEEIDISKPQVIDNSWSE